MKVGLTLFTANELGSDRKRPYRAIREIAQRAEADGFDSVWLPDHLMYRNPDKPTRGVWECWTFVAALAEATRRVEIGTLVLCNSFRPPALLAKMATAADEVSDGRLILGVGAGWHEPEYRAFGVPFDHRVDRFEEAMQILGPLLRGERVDVDGRYYRAGDCENLPLGPRPDGPPLMVGGEGPRMLRLAARYGDLWNTGYLGRPETMKEPLARIGAACREVGRDPATLGVTAIIGVRFPDLATTPSIFDNPLVGTAAEIAAALRGYSDLGVRHVMFQHEPYTDEARRLLAEALHLYREEQPQAS